MKTSLIRFAAVRQRTGLSRTEVARRMAAGTFPQKLQLGVRTVAWLENEIDGWVAEQIRNAASLRKRFAAESRPGV